MAPTPGAGTLVDGTFAAGVAGAGAYAFINDLLYVELTGYRTVNFDTLNKLGQDPFGFPGTIDGIAPYWRVAVEPIGVTIGSSLVHLECRRRYIHGRSRRI